MMAIRPGPSDLDGYARLLDAFIGGGLAAEPFGVALMRLWAADRDLKCRAVHQREQQGEALLRAVQEGRLEALGFGQRWADLWACGYSRPPDVQHVLDGLHHWAYFYSADPATRASDPSYFIDDRRLLKLITPLRNELMRLIAGEHA